MSKLQQIDRLKWDLVWIDNNSNRIVVRKGSRETFFGTYLNEDRMLKDFRKIIRGSIICEDDDIDISKKYVKINWVKRLLSYIMDIIKGVR